ncbi:LOW QUALITY PROTEIN: acidic amino acid decarboxylase GADL1-like [Epinephelus fuscoguttatus]|uniref:LOW QUALITY PROTEIN: acidic amino acid decarboxylase GADL1-like n=1 Tax=Epinephelus fuscoguttatus TaxID=293821 RepID=UPI0020D0BBB8|nr:LOW QUALITY PROTEIN: acidic amino acid decarboxylase GADL1-like [Epinephelus fuscoguttatus]
MALDKSAATGYWTHPRFFNQLYAGMEPYSVVASFIAEALKPSLYTYEAAPFFTLMEDAVLRKMMEMTGWEEGGDGIFNAGGSRSNMYAMNIARFHHCPDIKEDSLSAVPQLVIFTSQEACWSGAALVSKKHKHMLKGINRANSVAWNPHKMLIACLQCCAFLVRDKTNLLLHCHSGRACYLFQQDKFNDVSYDTGDKGGAEHSLGQQGLLEAPEGRKARPLVIFCPGGLKKREGFSLLMEPEYAKVCFWGYIPPSLRNLPEGPELWKKLHTVLRDTLGTGRYNPAHHNYTSGPSAPWPGKACSPDGPGSGDCGAKIGTLIPGAADRRPPPAAVRAVLPVSPPGARSQPAAFSSSSYCRRYQRPWSELHFIVVFCSPKVASSLGVCPSALITLLEATCCSTDKLFSPDPAHPRTWSCQHLVSSNPMQFVSLPQPKAVDLQI